MYELFLFPFLALLSGFSYEICDFKQAFLSKQHIFPAGIQTTVLQRYMNYPLRQMSKFIATQNKIVSTVFSSGLQAIKPKDVM